MSTERSGVLKTGFALDERNLTIDLTMSTKFFFRLHADVLNQEGNTNSVSSCYSSVIQAESTKLLVLVVLVKLACSPNTLQNNNRLNSVLSSSL